MAEPMKIRATLSGDTADIKVLMNHPMETGQRKDAKTGQIVPALFIQEVIATLNGKQVLSADFGVGISKNPYLWFKCKGAKVGDKIEISWTDNTGDKNAATAEIAAG
jgi:sulfur-oxidizing protein SoxZ